MPQSAEQLLEELTLGPAQGRRQQALSVEVVRTLKQDDLQALAKPQAAAPSLLLRIRHSHHQLAQGVAEGLSNQAISLTTGYDPAYISKLKADPSFAELVEFYKAQKDQALVDVMARMRQLGLSVVDELQHQFDEDPAKFTLREKMELCELMLVKSGHVGAKQQPGHPGGGASAPFALHINFVSPPSPEQLEVGKVIEGEKA